jgi:energy-coupling factor transporter ATP-binding protein EcfA2
VTPGEPAPLVLDEVTAQSDRRRTAAVLDLLHELSRERQIVIFSQEEEVLAWARERLDRQADRLIELGQARPAS